MYITCLQNVGFVLQIEAGTKAETSEQNTSRLSDEEAPYAKAR